MRQIGTPREEGPGSLDIRILKADSGEMEVMVANGESNRVRERGRGGEDGDQRGG